MIGWTERSGKMAVRPIPVDAGLPEDFTGFLVEVTLRVGWKDAYFTRSFLVDEVDDEWEAWDEAIALLSSDINLRARAEKLLKGMHYEDGNAQCLGYVYPIENGEEDIDAVDIDPELLPVVATGSGFVWPDA